MTKQEKDMILLGEALDKARGKNLLKKQKNFWINTSGIAAFVIVSYLILSKFI